MDTSTPLDPCPEGFKYNSATESCEHVDAEDGDSYVKTESIATAITTIFQPINYLIFKHPSN